MLLLPITILAWFTSPVVSDPATSKITKCGFHDLTSHDVLKSWTTWPFSADFVNSGDIPYSQGYGEQWKIYGDATKDGSKTHGVCCNINQGTCAWVSLGNIAIVDNAQGTYYTWSTCTDG